MELNIFFPSPMYKLSGQRRNLALLTTVEVKTLSQTDKLLIYINSLKDNNYSLTKSR